MSFPQQQSVGPREIVAAVVAVLGVVLLLGWLSAPRSAPPPASPAHGAPQTPGPPRELDDPKNASVHADALARQSGGDLTKLSEQDQRWLDASTAGHAREFLAARVKALKMQDRSAPVKPRSGAANAP